jgi:Rap1a immunity proteins
MGRGLNYLATIAIITGISSGARAAAVTRDDFLIATTANLVSLCSAAESDPLYTPARNFCQGFTVGTYRLIATEEAATRSRQKLFCMPANGPTRDDAIAKFVQWASGRPKTLASSPTDGMVEYLTTQFPCG